MVIKICLPKIGSTPDIILVRPFLHYSCNVYGHVMPFLSVVYLFDSILLLGMGSNDRGLDMVKHLRKSAYHCYH